MRNRTPRRVVSFIVSVVCAAALAACDEAAQTDLVYTDHLFRDAAAAPFPAGEFRHGAAPDPIFVLRQSADDPTLYQLDDGDAVSAVRFVPAEAAGLAAPRDTLVMIDYRSRYNAETARFEDRYGYRVMMADARKYRLKQDLAALLSLSVGAARCPDLLGAGRNFAKNTGVPLPAERLSTNDDTRPGYAGQAALDAFASGVETISTDLYPGPKLRRQDYDSDAAYGKECLDFAESTFIQRYGIPSALTAPELLSGAQRPAFKTALGDAIALSERLDRLETSAWTQFLSWLGGERRESHTLAALMLSTRQTRDQGWLTFTARHSSTPPLLSGEALCAGTILWDGSEEADAPSPALIDFLSGTLPLKASHCPQLETVTVQLQDGPSLASLTRDRDGWTAAWAKRN